MERSDQVQSGTFKKDLSLGNSKLIQICKGELSGPKLEQSNPIQIWNIGNGSKSGKFNLDANLEE